MATVTLVAGPVETVRGDYGRQDITLRSYDVLVDGVKVGFVAQHRADTTHGYSGSRLGYRTTRTCWLWAEEGNAGNSEMSSRKAALADMLGFLGVEA